MAEQYRSAGRDASSRRALAQLPDSGVARLQVWHASKTLDWAHSYEEDVRLELAQARGPAGCSGTHTRGRRRRARRAQCAHSFR